MNDLQQRYDLIVGKIMALMPECWDGDTDDVIDFVESLAGATGMPGHRDDCTCFTG